MLDVDISAKKILPFAVVGVGIIVLLAGITGIDKIIDAFYQTRKDIYALAFLTQVAAITVWLMKWRILADAIDLEVRTSRMFPILLSGIFVNTAVPSAKVGGEPLRGYMFSKLGEVRIEKSFASVAADRALDGVPFLTIIFSSLFFVILQGGLSFYTILLLLLAAVVATIAVVSFLYVVLRPSSARGLIFWLIRRLRRIIRKFRPIEYVEQKVEKFISEFGVGSKKIFQSKPHTVSALSLSFLYWLLSMFRMWLVFFALDQSVSLATIGLAITLGLILQAIPIPGGLGVVEGVYILIFQAAGIPEGDAFTAALLDRGVSFWFTCLFSGGGIAWSSLKLSKIMDDQS